MYNDVGYILTTDGVRKDFNGELTAYYNGRTSKGACNDNMGNAFLITYFDAGAK